MGNFHPHGDSAIYDTLVRMAQDFALRYPLVDGQGNFGSIDDDPPAAMRYTEARLRAARHGDAARHRRGHRRLPPNYDESRQEPLILPARFPNLLVNGSPGIAVGMATNIPPHNLRETIDAVVAYIDDPDDRRRRADEAHQGPGLPDRRHHRRAAGDPEAYETGRGRVVVRGRAHIEPLRAGQGGDHRHRAALPGEQGRRRATARPDREDRRARARKKITEICDLRDESDVAACGS